MFRPFRNRRNFRAFLSSEQLQIAMKANQLYSNGQAAEAAPLFARLAQDLEDSHHPRRAANLHTQAAHAFVDSHNESSGLEQSRRALALFIQYQMVERTPRFYGNITQKMSRLGMKDAAESLQKEFGGLAGPMSTTRTLSRIERYGSLPPDCTQCGAPLRSDEVDWIDDQTVECAYCGGLIKTSDIQS
jgi:hypothetical protein